ncbi:lytic murein transglycosylase [Roseovarius sp. D0-M9]|uniref:lytic murein transglycosylase n=1 Tax=Roseovarius sp. D0-M9 TaxID=3127117 RepID=UPI0030102671
MRFLPTLTALALCATPAFADPSCGGNFSGFVADLRQEAVDRGHDADAAQKFFAEVRQDPAVLKADRAQGVFQKPFTEFAQRLISTNRLDTGIAKGEALDSLFDRIEAEYGVSRGILLAFWAFETDFGGYQGDFNTLNALVTLAHDCRRPEIFRPQIFAALTLFERGDFDPQSTTGAWAGEIGMVQMLPQDIIDSGTDGDGDGRVSLTTSAPDALMSGGQMLRHLGWRAGEPWLQEVAVPADFDWSQSGLRTTKTGAEWAEMGITAREEDLAPTLDANILLPEGRRGPAFIAYPNFRVLFEWNQSFTYVLTAAYFATRLEGAPVMSQGNPDPGLSGGQMKQLQQKLAAQGYDVGEIDGILGAGTRAAVQDVQEKLGLPADAWPTQDLLNRL